MWCTQVVGKETQHRLAVLLGLTLLAQVREAQQPAEGKITFGRQQRSQFHAQTALVDIAKLDQFQRRQGRADTIVQRGITQISKLFDEVFADQVIAEYFTGHAVGQQDAALRVGDQGCYRQALQAISHKAPRIAGTADGLFKGKDAPLQHIALAGGRATPFRKDLGFVIQACQFPAKVGEDYAQAPPIPDQVTEQQTDQARCGAPPVAQAQ